MTDLSDTILANSDQLNADDIINQEPILTITNVTKGDDIKQPINMGYEGSGGKVWRPCKSMRRVLVSAWGTDGQQYVGRQVQVYRDPNVIYAGKKVGGIRIKAMSHIDKQQKITLSEVRGKKKDFIVNPLPTVQVTPPQQPQQTDLQKATAYVDGLIVSLQAAPTQAEVDALLVKNDASLARIESAYTELYNKLKPYMTKHPPADEPATAF